MFGIAKPCRHHLTPELRRQWMGHLCGLCLALRDENGQAARATTNVDAVVLSVLVEAQRPEPLGTRRAGPCPLRGMRAATVIAPDEGATVHATAVSLTMAATKVADHAVDGDGLPGRLPRVAGGVARRWSAAGERAGRRVAFDTGVLADAVADATAREKRRHLSFDDYVAPTEEAAAAACRHTAVLAGTPQNLDALTELGRMFGRITYLLDAVEDAAEDRARGRFNALAAAFPEPCAGPPGLDRLVEARRLFDDAHHRLVTAFSRLDLARPELAETLLVRQLRTVGDAKLGRSRHGHGAACRSRTEALPRGRTVRALAQLSVATGLAFPGFRPDNPGGGPGGVPGGEVPPNIPAPPDEQKQHWWNNITGDDATDCCCDLSCCCCCDSCCDGCDCCCDC